MMMRWCVLMLAILWPATAQEAGKPTAKQTSGQARAAEPGGPPAGAQSIGQNAYKWKDSDGVAWIYRKRPFGWSRIKESDEQALQSPAKPTPDAPESRSTAVAPSRPAPKITEVKGDDVVFERPSAFGMQRWTKNKGELDAEEKAALERWGRQPAAKPAPAKAQ